MLLFFSQTRPEVPGGNARPRPAGSCLALCPISRLFCPHSVRTMLCLERGGEARRAEAAAPYRAGSNALGGKIGCKIG